MSRDIRKSYYRDREEYRSYEKHRSKRSPPRENKHRSRSPRKCDKDVDENILREISKLPEPNEMWESQFNDNSYPTAPPAPSFSQDPVYRGVYDEFPTMASMPPAPQPPEIAWNQLSLPPPPVQSSFPSSNMEDQIKKEAAIESEMRHQKATLSKQREDYIKKSTILKKELETLKDQRNELRGDTKRSPSPETKRFLKENTKLQLEIQNKLKTINNVVDMLNGIIGEEAEPPETDDSSERGSKRRSRSPTTKKCNYVYYDPEMHWCRICNEFPPTAKDYLNHLHSPSHQKMAAAHMEAPWHSISGLNEGFPNYPSATTKRTPIRGLQFFVPSTAWYCKLCDQFIGDLHCASAHLKSVIHSKNYSNFVEQNPHWETDWMSDRQKAFEKMRTAKIKLEEKPQYTAHTITFNKDGFHTKKKKSLSPALEDKKEKKKKKEKKTRKRKKSSSSSSNSDSSSSDSDLAKKKKMKS
ncbi:Zinc finger matrin-type protein CG9776 [Eumeta japonica]|uniref:Zinc finger matrin-type protein CG9776 n=1 Tax=Eumeta variegata TaxID=151549 RepID=A0A4C1SPU6_EUMVA|nr:Zinc finger matrin-type protein CG9776 [Eumeta japonica]